jgi:hypothetical protein
MNYTGSGIVPFSSVREAAWDGRFWAVTGPLLGWIQEA